MQACSSLCGDLIMGVISIAQLGQLTVSSTSAKANHCIRGDVAAVRQLASFVEAPCDSVGPRQISFYCIGKRTEIQTRVSDDNGTDNVIVFNEDATIGMLVGCK